MMFRVVPRITAKLRLAPRRRAPASFVWGLGVGVVAGVALVAGIVQRLGQRKQAERGERATDGAHASPSEPRWDATG